MEEPTNKTIVEKVLTTKTVGKAQRLMSSRSGTFFLTTISYLEALLPLPIMTDPFLMAAILANRARTTYLIFVTIISSVLGGFSAYIVAVLFRELLLATLSPDMLSTLQSFVSGHQQDTFILTIIGAITPVPYTIIAWAIALGNGNPLVFIFASLIGRGFRYGVVGWCTYHFGPLAIRYAKRSILLTSLAIFIFAGVYVWLKM